MKGFDSFAGAIKSGGKTRRAAKMVILNIDHPDIEEFILSKANEEKKAWALIDAGYDGSFNGEAYASIFYQNANHSIRVTDEFMDAVEKDGEWQTKEVLTGQPLQDATRRASSWRKIADSAWVCGDPGMQYDTTINRWNPVKATHRINASNPCSEYMFVDDSACNLASLNLMKFFNAEDGSFDVADASATRATSSSRRRRCWSTTAPTRRRRSPRTPTSSVRSASATRTSARS